MLLTAQPGSAHPPSPGLTGQVRADGVLLSWQPAAEPQRSVSYRIERLQLDAPAPKEAPKSPLAPAVPAAAQTLVVHGKDGEDPGHAIDSSALFNQRYRYALERVATLAVSGKSVEVQGMPSDAIVVVTTDVFPPRFPRGWWPWPMRLPAPSISPGRRTAIAIWRLTTSTGVMCMETCRPSASLPWGLRPHTGMREHNPNIRMLIPCRPSIKVAMRASVPPRSRRLPSR
jgi:hypothetical protein